LLIARTNSLPGDTDAAIILDNELSANGSFVIRELVKKGYIVRSRADAPIDTMLNKIAEVRFGV
jgi:hypothetical protein